MEGDSKCTDALDDVELCTSMPISAVGISEYVTPTQPMPASSRPIHGFIHAFFNRPISSRIKRMMGRRKGNDTRVVLTQQETITMSSSSSTVDVGFATTSGCEPSASNGVSSRIERLMQRRSEYASALEFEIEASKDHWSQLHPTSDDDEVIETDVEIFESLRKKWGDFFRDWGDRLVVGEKIAEGGQAEIFNAELTFRNGSKQECVLKVFKEGYSLRDLEKQWPLGMLQNRPKGVGYYTANSCLIFGAVLLKNGRFAFRMNKYWGDLRKLIDFRMQCNHNQSPPFTQREVELIVVRIAQGMHELHELNIIHRDLKASNVFIRSPSMEAFDPIQGVIMCDVADFECSVGVVGTGYWRAPEILQALQDGNIKLHLFTEKSDVYSYAMTCYEVLTGSIPFEDLDRSCYDVVIQGKRPELPNYIEPLFITLLNRCWHANPLERPSFEEITGCLLKLYPRHESLY